ncbi:MAG: Hsp20/alpha crystallin family protein [Planctomycetota bacterium]|jgi:HSP20 family protein
MVQGGGDYESWRRQVERLVRSMAGVSSMPGFGPGGVWSPATDVFETAQGVVVKMELPGLSPEDVSIVLVDNRLVVKGSRRDPDRGRKIEYQQMEIAFGPFVKIVHLNMPYESERIRATLKDGYLDLVIPKTSKPTVERTVVEIRL